MNMQITGDYESNNNTKCILYAYTYHINYIPTV